MFDFRNLRPTDLPSNKHIFLPQNERNRPYDEEEVQLAYLGLQLQKATDEISSTVKIKSNLTLDEIKGMNKLSKRDDVVTFQTDKSSRFCIDEKANYVKANLTHVMKDETINEQTYSRLQKEINAHSVMWAQFLKAGTNTSEHGHQRVKENMLSAEQTDPPPLYGLRKDHKECEDPVIEGPPTRPVCGATAAHNSKLSHLLSLILKEVKREDEYSCESTEDILAAIEMVNKGRNVESGKKLMVGSLDVKALYPSLDIPFAAKKISEEFMKSSTEFEDSSIDVALLGLYLVLTVNEDELVAERIRDFCPTRTNVLGRKPTITGQAYSTAEKRKHMWNPPIYPVPDKETLKKMLARALEVGINVTMNTHVYKFAGETMTQKNGGAIGLELTGEIAGVFMTWWDRLMRLRMENNGIKIVIYKRYVDDINLIIEMGEEESEGNVWKRIREIGNTIHKSIQLEADYTSNYPDMKVPILDVKVWVESTSNRVLHEYYSKPVSSKSVIDARSAMPQKNKRTVLTQDLLRVILRCSPDLAWQDKKKHIDEYVLRLQYSGYNERFRRDIVRSAISAHEKIKSKVERGERPLYRTKSWRMKERAKDKRKKRTSWYKSTNKESKRPYKSVLFVQPTKDSILKKKYEEVISKSDCEVKVVERAGKSVGRKLQKSYPFSKEKCVTKDCFVCLSDGKGNCKKVNINYEVECVREECRYVYIGETARNAFCRGKEHLRGLYKRDNDSVLVEHVRDCHNTKFDYDECAGFRMNVRETHTSTMNRLITEAVKIESSTRPTMNRKSGYRANSVLKLTSSRTSDSTATGL